MREQLTKLPRSLHSTYDRIWERISNGEPTERDWALKTLSWILVAKVPLTPSTILEATAREPFRPLDTERMASSVAYLVRACGNFVTLDAETGCVRFIHYSVQEYLREKQELHSAAERVAEICLTALSDEHLFALGPWWPSIPTDSTLFVYAVQHWEEYCRSWEVIDDRRGRLLRQFLLDERSFERWKLVRFLGHDDVGSVYELAAYFNLPVILHFLQQFGSQDASFPHSQSTALIVAARHADIEVVRTLLASGADANFHRTITAPVTETSFTCSDEITLLLHNAEVSESALMEAIDRNAPDIVELLLSAGADPNQNSTGTSGFSNPLYHAARGGLARVVRLLLAAGARPDAAGVIFARALQHRHYHLMQPLLDAGANPNGADGGERIPGADTGELIPLALAARDAEAVRVLLDAGARPDAQGYALREAVNECNEASVERLLAAGADPDAVAPHSTSALQLAVLGCGGKINPFRARVVRTSEAILKRLLDAGADPNAFMKVWNHPLNYAVWWCTPVAVRLLLDAGCEVNAPGWRGLPFRAAIERGDQAIIDLLRAKGATELPESEQSTDSPQLEMEGGDSQTRLGDNPGTCPWVTLEDGAFPGSLPGLHLSSSL